MKILTVDIGAGTQDIFLYDSHLDLENGLKLVMPSPTMIIHQRLRQATCARQAVLLTGMTMGGGPSQWAAEAHLKAGLPIYATPAAACTFNDDLEAVQASGIQILSEDEAVRLPADVLRLELCDFDFSAIQRSLAAFSVSLNDLAAVSVAVFDHGHAPPTISDRQFRFDYLAERIRLDNRLTTFAFPGSAIPPSMTRLQAVAISARYVDAPLVVMDSAPAAVLGTTFDPQVSSQRQVLAANLGNFHTLAFRLSDGKIDGVFEHHTGLLNLSRLEGYLRSLADGSLTHEAVFADHGHGALVFPAAPFPIGDGTFDVVITGPRRSLFNTAHSGEESLTPYFAVPFGDMMLAGCFGLLAAVAKVMPEFSDEIHTSLHNESKGATPWEVR